MTLDDYQQEVMALHGIAPATPTTNQETTVALARFLGAQLEALAIVCAKHGLSLASVAEIELMRSRAHIQGTL